MIFLNFLIFFLLIMLLQTLIFDWDGTPANTKHEGHLAISAGVKTVASLNEYTKANNFEGALVVLDHLGEEDKPFLIINGTPSDYSMVSVDYIKELYERNR